jgi:hypothetical protein
MSNTTFPIIIYLSRLEQITEISVLTFKREKIAGFWVILVFFKLFTKFSLKSTGYL